MSSPRCRARIRHPVSLLVGRLLLASGLSAQNRIALIPIPFEEIRELGDAKSDRHTLVFRTKQAGWSFHHGDGPIPIRILPRMNRIVMEVDALADHVEVRWVGHEPVTIPLNRMDVGRRQDFELRLFTDTPVRDTGRLHVTVSPLNAHMQVENSTHALRNGLNELPEGSYVIRITHPAHLEERRLVWVDGGRMRSVEWILTPRVEQSLLRVRTDPESAVFVNGREIGEGSAYVGVQPVPHRIEIRHPAGNRRLTVTPNSSGITDVPIFALADRSSALHIGQFAHLLMYEPPYGWRTALEINPHGPLIRVEW